MISQGEIWMVSLEPTIGDEIGRTSPAVVLSSNSIGKLKLKTVAPITGWAKQFQLYPWMIRIKNNTNNGLAKESSIDCFQVKSISTYRFVKKIGFVDVETLFLIHEVVLKTFNPEYSLI